MAFHIPAKYKKQICLTLLGIFFFSTGIVAGPPYDTDDPETLAFEHWEFYCSTIGSESDHIWAGAVPYFECNYGATSFLQLHINVPLNLYSMQGDRTYYGFGQTELAAKIRFVGNDSSKLQICIYPAVELYTANASKNLGAQTQLYLPLWIEKKFNDKWSSCLGGGYWINPGTGNKNYVYMGWQGQFQFAKAVSVGAEIEYLTASTDGGSDVYGGSNDLRFRVGSIADLSELHHLLFSVGRSIIGPTNLLWYIGYQLTI